MKSVFAPLAVFVLFLNVMKAQPPASGDDARTLVQVPELADFTSPEMNKWDFFLYPVPANEELNIKIVKGTHHLTHIRVLDQAGNLVLETDDIEASKYRIDITGLKPGTYYLQATPDNNDPSKMKRFYVLN